MALTKLCKGFDELDPYVEHLIKLKVVEWLEKEPGDSGPLLELVLDIRRIKLGRQGKDTLYLSVYLLCMDSFVKLIDSLLKL